MKPENENANKWSTILRCRPTMEWPIGEVFPVFSVEDKTPEGMSYKAQLGIISWADDDAKSTWTVRHSALAHRDMLPNQRDVRFTQGQQSSSPTKFLVTKAKLGEVDIHFSLTTNEVSPYRFAHDFGSSCCNLIRGYIGLVVGDQLVPIGPLDTFPRDSNDRVSPEFDVVVVDKFCLEVKPLSAALEGFGCSREIINSYSAEQRRAIGAAARRYFDAEVEPDSIDRFMDYWVVCEFLSVKNTWPRNGSPVDIITAELAKHSGVKRSELKPKIKHLYQIRGNLIHNAIENNPEFHNQLHLLAGIAKALLRYRYGLPDDGVLGRIMAGDEIPGIGVRVNTSIGSKAPDLE